MTPLLMIAIVGLLSASGQAQTGQAPQNEARFSGNWVAPTLAQAKAEGTTMPGALMVEQSGNTLIVRRMLMLGGRSHVFKSTYDLSGQPTYNGDESRYTRTTVQRRDQALIFTSTNETRVSWTQEWRLENGRLILTDTRWGPGVQLQFAK
jgi:hypothetical protein